MDTDLYTDVMYFLAAMESSTPSLSLPPPSIPQLVAYSVGRLPPEGVRDIEMAAIAGQTVRERLFTVFSVVKHLEDGGLRQHAITPSLDPLRSAIAYAYNALSQKRPEDDPSRTPVFEMVGRARESKEILTWLSEGKPGILLITGQGGVGKTCLLRSVAGGAVARFGKRGFYLECASFQDSSDFFRALAHTLNVESEVDIPAFLGIGPAVLFLDKIEDAHLAVEEIERLMGQAPLLRIVATSRKRIVSLNAKLIELSPLETAEGAGSEGMTLFHSFASRLLHNFRATASTLRPVRELCRLCQGVPLSMLIVAGCLPSMALEDLVAKLQAITAEAKASSTSPNIPSPVESALNLLSTEDLRTVRILAIFSGNFTFEQAQFLVDLSDESLNVSLSRLMRCGIVEQSEVRGEYCFKLHDAVAELVGEARGALSEKELIPLERHAALFFAEAERIGQFMDDGRWEVGISSLEMNHANLRKASARAGELQDHVSVRRIVDGLARTYFEAGYLSDFRALIDAGLIASEKLHDLGLASRILGLQGALLSRESDETACTQSWLRRLELCLLLEDLEGSVDTLTDLAWQAFQLGNLDASEKYLTQAEVLAGDSTEPAYLATIFAIRARILMKTGDAEQALLQARKTEAHLHLATNRNLTLFVRQMLAIVYRELGQAHRRLTETVLLLRESFEGKRAVLAGWSLAELADIYTQEGAGDTAALCICARYRIMNEYRTKHKRHAIAALDKLVSEAAPSTRSTVERALTMPLDDLLNQIMDRVRNTT